MKTSPTRPLQFSGYPLAQTDAKQEETPPAGKMPGEKTTNSPPKKRDKVLDVPENWDETWFANYE